jgi:ectoine hydroxylase-related dioxygenase (phytanoyl-CoA dioxygenase family)
MPERALREITEEEKAAYRDEGIVCLRQAFEPAWVEFLQDMAARDVENPSRMRVDATLAGTGRFFGDTFVWQHHNELRRFIFDSHAADFAASVMGTKKINLLFDQFLIKEAGTSTQTLWHHDLPYWPVGGDHVCTLWIALDSVTKESGAVEYVVGSHKWGQRYQAVSFKDDNLYKEDLPPVPDIDAMRDQFTFRQFELEPGDCTIHHGLTLHGAPGNASTTRARRAYVTRWTGDDAYYNPRPNIQPMLYDPDIAEGGPLDCELFPVVRRAG